MNDVMQVEGGGQLRYRNYFCDTLYESVGKTFILKWQRGKGVNFESKLREVIYECPLVELS